MPKRVNREAMQERILDAALGVFAERGTNAATMDDLAGAAGLGKGTLYLYFSSKDELILALVRRILRDIEAAFEELPDPHSIGELLDTIAEGILLRSGERNSIVMFFETFAPAFRQPQLVLAMSEPFDRIGAVITAKIVSLQKKGAADPDCDATAAGRALVAAIDGLVLHGALFDLPRERFGTMVRTLMHTFRSGLET